MTPFGRHPSSYVIRCPAEEDGVRSDEQVTGGDRCSNSIVAPSCATHFVYPFWTPVYLTNPGGTCCAGVSPVVVVRWEVSRVPRSSRTMASFRVANSIRNVSEVNSKVREYGGSHLHQMTVLTSCQST